MRAGGNNAPGNQNRKQTTLKQANKQANKQTNHKRPTAPLLGRKRRARVGLIRQAAAASQKPTTTASLVVHFVSMMHFCEINTDGGIEFIRKKEGKKERRPIEVFLKEKSRTEQKLPPASDQETAVSSSLFLCVPNFPFPFPSFLIYKNKTTTIQPFIH
jgi:hypothetical protein